MTNLEQLLRELNLAHHNAQEAARKFQESGNSDRLLMALDTLEIAEERLRSLIEKAR